MKKLILIIVAVALSGCVMHVGNQSVGLSAAQWRVAGRRYIAADHAAALRSCDPAPTPDCVAYAEEAQ